MDRDKLIEVLKHCEDYNSKYDGKPLDTNKLADYLIANGIGDIAAEKHRADVAEEALEIACEESSQEYPFASIDFLEKEYKKQAAERLKEKQL